MTSTLLVFQIVLSVVITIAVLLQKSSSIGLGAYSGSNETMFGAKGPAGFLTKFTFTVAILFIVNTLTLGYMYSQENTQSVVVNTEIPDNPVAVTTNTPDAPKAPAK
ncbi:Preprotein translocase subunit SecG (TC 3.A.5.1.1) [hydrothermal vent metagenome]|uniref:Preprotein translocase subunit SecG (TC 3.A.5.1.1) n=1 Tax=hydrothermal vent metagenome TaxID=652676 RepID=A0A1W1EKK7_9ZZZZ